MDLKTIIKNFYEEIKNIETYIEPESTITVSTKELKLATNQINISNGSFAYMSIKRVVNEEQSDKLIKRFSIVQNLKFDIQLGEYIKYSKPKYYVQTDVYDNYENLVHSSEIIPIDKPMNNEIYNTLNQYINKSLIDLNNKIKKGTQ